MDYYKCGVFIQQEYTYRNDLSHFCLRCFVFVPHSLSLSLSVSYSLAQSLVRLLSLSLSPWTIFSLSLSFDNDDVDNDGCYAFALVSVPSRFYAYGLRLLLKIVINGFFLLRPHFVWHVFVTIDDCVVVVGSCSLALAGTPADTYTMYTHICYVLSVPLKKLFKFVALNCVAIRFICIFICILGKMYLYIENDEHNDESVEWNEF